MEDVNTKRRHRPPPVYFRGCRPISQLFMMSRDGFFFMMAVGPQRLRVSQLSYLLWVREHRLFASSSEPHSHGPVCCTVPLSTSCLIHPTGSFPQWLLLLSSEVHSTSGSLIRRWITEGEVGVTGASGEQG